MTAADRLRAAVEAALCNCDRSAGYRATGECWESCASRTRSAAVRAAVLLVEELERDRERLRARHNPEVCVDVQEHNAAQGREVARLRAVLEWVYEGPIDSVGVIDMALRGDWPAVRAAGVALPEPKP